MRASLRQEKLTKGFLMDRGPLKNDGYNQVEIVY